MPWFKVDDKLHDHRKARSARKAAMGVWVLAGSWAADNLTDGFIPATLLPRWGTRADAARLVECGLWHPAEQDGEKGWRFHEWAERQPTRAQKLAERAVRAEAGRVGGKASGASRRQAKTKQSASGLVEPPARPGPTHAAAAASEGGSGSIDLPVGVEILRSKMTAVTALSALRWDVKDIQLQQIADLIEIHGDQRLVDVAVRTCRTPPPISVSAFIGTWQAMPEPGRTVRAVDDQKCHECGLTIAACDRKAKTDPEFCPRKESA